MPYSNYLQACYNSSNKGAEIQLRCHRFCRSRPHLTPHVLFSSRSHTARPVPAPFWSTEYIQMLQNVAEYFRDGVLHWWSHWSLKADQRTRRFLKLCHTFQTLSWSVYYSKKRCNSDVYRILHNMHSKGQAFAAAPISACRPFLRMKHLRSLTRSKLTDTLASPITTGSDTHGTWHWSLCQSKSSPGLTLKQR